jgi:hypothetical protein
MKPLAFGLMAITNESVECVTWNSMWRCRRNLSKYYVRILFINKKITIMENMLIFRVIPDT